MNYQENTTAVESKEENNSFSFYRHFSPLLSISNSFSSYLFILPVGRTQSQPRPARPRVRTGRNPRCSTTARAPNLQGLTPRDFAQGGPVHRGACSTPASVQDQTVSQRRS